MRKPTKNVILNVRVSDNLARELEDYAPSESKSETIRRAIYEMLSKKQVKLEAKVNECQ